ncbi:cleavage factor two protein 1 [Histoplasma capsulatum var. duboisii H88]|uniref:Protein CFT1 n=2 Tax=Ajellomyces capsulatus TaxID=5037 RepID=A0A8A1LGP9_AJEC8|nr:cleavage factor two protein 1 [Histoplasma capsulatum H143]QSS53558.1 cleavage factor two protein 1 [Histoplasma capsulatum var. duboisii H88]
MQCYTELLPPSGVTHALSVPFLSATSNNLIVAKTTLLQVFNLVNVVYGSGPGQPDEKIRSQYTKLVLVAEYALSGTITDLGRVKILDSKSGGEAVLVATRNAKLSLIEWDPERHQISTTSIHYYERDDVNISPWTPNLASCPSYLTVDPSSRCAVLNFGKKNLAILPFHQVGDDLVMDDFDSDVEEPHRNMNQTAEETDEANKSNGPVFQTPYASSFVLPIAALEPSMLHPISLAFLYEYREPTFGILYSQVATSSALLHDRKDVVFYSVFTLDLEQRASTTLLSVSRLPNDLFKVVPLPPPVGGALLIGSNELVHIDQAGKTNAVGVNEFAREASSFSMADQSDLEMRLEDSIVEQLGAENGDMLLVLLNGKMAVLSFKLDGRSVSGISLRPVPDQAGSSLLKAKPSCSVPVSRGKIFFGSEEGDSVLMGWSRPSARTKDPRAQRTGEGNIAQLSDEDDDDEEEDDDDDAYEDDLYATPMTTGIKARDYVSVNGTGFNDYIFRIHDRLWNLGPMRDLTLGRPPGPRDKDKRQPVSSILTNLELVTTQGYGKAGGLAILRREIDPFVIDSLMIKDTDGARSVYVKDPKLPSQSGSLPLNPGSNYDHYLLLSKSKGLDKEKSVVYRMSSGGLEETKAPEFNPNEDRTIDIGTLASGTRVVQVLKGEVRSYDSGLGLAQIFPVWDEDMSEEKSVVHTSFADPYVLIIRDDQSILLLQADESGDLDEAETDGIINSTTWISGSLYQDKYRSFNSYEGPPNMKQSDNVLLFLLSSESKLYVFHLPNAREPVFTTESIDLLPQILSTEPPPRRVTYRETITELLVADLGDSVSRSPYLILRSSNSDLTLYEPYHYTSSTEKQFSDLRFVKIANHHFPKFHSESNVEKHPANCTALSKPLRVLGDVCGYRTVFMPGNSPCFIIKSSTSIPHVMNLRGKTVHSLSSFNIPACEKGFVYVDTDNVVRMCRFPRNTHFDGSWAARKIGLGEQVDAVEYSSSSETYVIGTNQKVDFNLPEDDEIHPEWRNEVISFLPQIDKGSVKLLTPRTWSIIDSYNLRNAERIMCVKCLNLEVSEITHERKDTIVVGTALTKGEDIAARGCIYIFEVIKVVPEVDRPETNRKLKLIAKEEVKGAVTSLSGIGGQGFLIAAQGQKCIVRGLKEDGSLLPVAFMDMQCYVNVLKELKGTGMCIMGDALKGLWFAGYSEEPYKLSLFSKDDGTLQVMAADFLPDGNRLYILVADDDCNIHVLQYDPEDPGSSKGDRLLHRSTFQTGHFASTMTLLPRTATSSSQGPDADPDMMDLDSSGPLHHVLVTSETGSIALITPVSETSYRRLSALQSQLANTLEHPCGLNPRAFRAVESDGIGGRGMVDGDLVKRWLDLGTQRKAEIANRVGADVWEIRADLEAIGKGGLGYL